MTSVYVVSYALMGDVEAERDDPSDRDLPDEEVLRIAASPGLVEVSASVSEDRVLSWKRLLLDELEYYLEENELTEDDLSWETDGWRDLGPDEGRSHQCWLVYHGDDCVGAMVVQRVELRS